MFVCYVLEGNIDHVELWLEGIHFEKYICMKE